jgi:predicted DNA-binding transcriptional regulator YafY
MRADRLLSVLMLLQARGRMTARELSERLEVSERTVYRDISALGMAGIPVYAERGPGGGCMLSEGYRTNLTGLSEAEARTLVLAMASRPLKDLGMGGALDAALLKLLAALPSRVRAGAEQARQRVHVDTAGWGAPEATPHLRALEEAVWQERRVRVSYRDGVGKLAERVIEPLGLVAKASIWYLVAAVEGELRVYRVSRMRAVTPLEETFARPEIFDLAAYWEESSRRFQESWGQYPVTLRVAPELLEELPQIYGAGVQETITQAGPPDAEGWTTLALTFQTFEHARTQVLGMGRWAEVITPAELRVSIIERARDIAAFYSERATAEA